MGFTVLVTLDGFPQEYFVVLSSLSNRITACNFANWQLYSPLLLMNKSITGVEKSVCQQNGKREDVCNYCNPLCRGSNMALICHLNMNVKGDMVICSG